MDYLPGQEVFAGFDFQRHRTFSERPSSVQIDLPTLRQAVQDGLAFDRKENNEIVIGVRPDQFVDYVRNATRLHWTGSDSRTFGLVTQAAASPSLPAAQVADLDEAITTLTEPRRIIVQEVRRLAREANFREKVLRAYGSRCAVTGIQLRLVDAAHILPVGAPESLDTVRNGIALTPTYHRAFDGGLIYVDESYSMQLNPAKEEALRALGLIDGLDNFRATLGSRIFLPPDRSQWPSKQLIRLANRFRRIA